MPSLGIAPYPGGCVGTNGIPSQGWRRFQASFRRMRSCIIWRLGFRQSSFRHITRISQRVAPYAWTRPLVCCHAIVPFVFRLQVRHQIQEHPSKFLPAEPGIRQGASWRSTHLLKCPHWASLRAPEGCARHLWNLPQGPAPVSGVFPAGVESHLLEIGIQAIQLSPCHAGPPAPRPIRLGTTAGFLACYFPRFSFDNE
jgi:hypothetical protein